MAKVVFVILFLIFRDVVGSNSFDHVPAQCRPRDYGDGPGPMYDDYGHGPMHDYDYEFDSSQLMTNIVDDFLELDLLSLNFTMEAFCNWRPWFVNFIKRSVCSQHATRDCRDENGDPIELDYNDPDFYYCPIRYPTEPKSVYWFMVNTVKVMEKKFDEEMKYWKEDDKCKNFEYY